MFINKDKRPNSSKVDVVGCKEYFPSNYTIPKIIEIYADIFNIKINQIFI